MSVLSEVLTWREGLSHLIWAGILTMAGRFIAWMWGKSLANRERAFWVSGILGFFLLFSALAYIAKPSLTPDLKGNIDFWMGGERTDPQGNPDQRTAYYTGLMLIVSIRNLGMPTTVENWSLEVTPPGGNSFKAEMVSLTPTMTMHTKTGEAYIWSGQDALYDKTIEKPIPTGATVRGLLGFVCVGAPPENIVRPGTTFLLKFKDVMNNEYSAQLTVSSTFDQFIPFPGIHQPLRVPSTKNTP